MRWFVKPSHLRESLEKEGTGYLMDKKLLTCGWGNGYVELPKGHLCYGLGYDEIHDRFRIEVNGGLTLANHGFELGWEELNNPEESWVVGFDTAHSWDTIEMWPKEQVEAEAKRLFDQMLEIGFNLLE